MAKEIEVSALVPEKKDSEGNVTQAQLGPCDVTVKFGETAQESIEMFGDEAVNSNALAKWIVILQGNIRSALKRGEAPVDIASRLSNAKLGVAASGGRVSAEVAYKMKFVNSSPGDRKAMIAELKKIAQ